MSWIIHPKEFEAVLRQSAPKRYAYFIKKVVDYGAIWSLQDDSGGALASDGERDLIPLWPHYDYARACAEGLWSGNTPTRIGLEQWLATGIPGAISDGIGVAAFPTPGGSGIVITPERLQADLEHELKRLG